MELKQLIWPKGYKTFFHAHLNWAWNFNCSKNKIAKNIDFLAFKLSDVFIMLINVKMPTIVGILTFISMINFMLSWVTERLYFLN